MYVYFPSCNFTAASPAATEKIKAWMRDHVGARIEGCCRAGVKKLSPDETAVTICQSCSAIVREAGAPAQEISVFELLDADNEFPWPDLGGEAITLQDCWRAREKDALHEAARRILHKMNAKVVELPENRRNVQYDGTFRMMPMREANLKIAPKFYGANMEGHMTLCPPEEQQERLKAQAEMIATDRVACVCNLCLAGLTQGGAKAVHLMDLVMGTAE